MAVVRSRGMLIGTMSGGGAITPEVIAGLATEHSAAPVDMLGNDLSDGLLHLWLFVKRVTGDDGAAASVKCRINGKENPTLSGQPGGEDYITKAAEWDFEADVQLDDAGYKSIYLGYASSIPRYVSAEIYNGRASDSIHAALRYELVKIS